MHRPLRSIQDIAHRTGRLAFVLALGASAGCVYVDLQEDAVGVRVARSLDEVADCREKGTIGATTKATVAGIGRSEEDVAVELERMARNRAGRLAANTVVPLGPVAEDGSRQFGAYACPD